LIMRISLPFSELDLKIILITHGQQNISFPSLTVDNQEMTDQETGDMFQTFDGIFPMIFPSIKTLPFIWN